MLRLRGYAWFAVMYRLRRVPLDQTPDWKQRDLSLRLCSKV